MPIQELFPALKNLIDNSKEKTGSGYTLTYKEVNTRHSGIITLPEDIFFENPQDYLQFIDKEKDFLAFRKAVDLTKRQAPALLSWLEAHVLKVQKHAEIWSEIWSEILKIIAFFNQNPYPLSTQPFYWRQLPIDVDLASMEVYQPLIAELLDAILPPNYIQTTETLFEKRSILSRPVVMELEAPRGIQSILMDKMTFDAFPQHHENIKISNPNAFLTHLNDDELAMYQFLINSNDKNGLLQRNVSHSFFLKQLKAIQCGE